MECPSERPFLRSFTLRGQDQSLSNTKQWYEFTCCGFSFDSSRSGFEGRREDPMFKDMGVF